MGPAAPAYDDRRPLFVATERPNLAIMRLLLQAQAVVDGLGARGGTPLQIASEEGNLECARLLIEWGADVNAAIDLKVDVNNGGFTPLTSACGSGHSDVVAFFSTRAPIRTRRPLKTGSSRKRMVETLIIRSG